MISFKKARALCFRSQPSLLIVLLFLTLLVLKNLLFGTLLLTRDTSRSFHTHIDLLSADSTNFSGVLARSFPSWPSDQPLPCFQADPRTLALQFQDTTEAKRGLLYMKPHKCGSTTAAAVQIRIARNVYRRTFLGNRSKQQQPSYSDMCEVRFTHGDPRVTAVNTRQRLSSLTRQLSPSQVNNATIFGDESSLIVGDNEKNAKYKEIDLISEQFSQTSKRNVYSPGSTDVQFLNTSSPLDKQIKNRAEDVRDLRSTIGSSTTIRNELLPKIYTRGNRYGQRLRNLSFLWTIIREPTKRYISQFFFLKVSVNQLEPTDENFEKFLFREGYRHYYLCVLSTTQNNAYFCQNPWNRTTQTVDPSNHEESPGLFSVSASTINSLNEMIQQYDFIGVMERFDESLVVLKMLLGLKLADIVYLKSKTAGSFVPYKNKICKEIVPSFTSNYMSSLFKSDLWQRHILSDKLFYQAANRSLDLTIDRLGRKEVEHEVMRLQQANKLASQQCEGKVIYPCEKDGGKVVPDSRTHCFALDIGCGMECLDEISDELGLW